MLLKLEPTNFLGLKRAKKQGLVTKKNELHTPRGSAIGISIVKGKGTLNVARDETKNEN